MVIHFLLRKFLQEQFFRTSRFKILQIPKHPENNIPKNPKNLQLESPQKNVDSPLHFISHTQWPIWKNTTNWVYQMNFGLVDRWCVGTTIKHPGRSFPIWQSHCSPPLLLLKNSHSKCRYSYLFYFHSSSQNPKSKIFRRIHPPKRNLRECVKWLPSVMREKLKISTWIRENEKQSAWMRFCAILREIPIFFSVRECARKKTKSAWLRDLDPPWETLL